MSIEQEDRFKRADTSVTHVRREFDEAIHESIAAEGEANEDVREAIADVETRIDTLRTRTEEEYLVQ